MSYTTIAAEVKTVLESVSGIGNVHDRIRFWKDREGKITLGVASGTFHLWFIRRSGLTGTPMTDAGVVRAHVFDLIGFYEVDDANSSETTFQAIVDLVLDKFDLSTNLSLGNEGDQVKPAQMGFDDVELSDTLCHRAIVRIEAVEEV